MTTVVEVHDVSKRFVIRKEKSLKERVVNLGRSNRFKEDFWALRHVNLEIESGSTVGLIGPTARARARCSSSSAASSSRPKARSSVAVGSPR